MERDETLLLGLCSAALNNRRELHEWAEAELKAILVQAELQETLVQGMLGDEVKKVVERLRAIGQTELPIAVREHEEVRTDTLHGSYDDILDAYRKLDRETARLVQIVSELLDLRSFIGDMG